MTGLRHSLLLIEDSIDDEALSLRAIERSGVPCDVAVVRHGAEALDLLLAQDGPTPDLIVLDFHLPGCNGLEILRALRANPRTKRLPIVILTGLGSPNELKDCLDEGANSCVEKPTDAGAYQEHVGLIVRYWLTVDKRTENPRKRYSLSTPI